MAGAVGAGSVRGEGQPLDILCNAQTNRKAKPLLEALQRGGVAAGFDARLVDHHQIRPKSWLFVYGLGGLDRMPYIQRGRLVAFDLAYWDRKGAQRKYRVSINGLHCPERIMRGPTPSVVRWKLSGLVTAKDADGEGPILLVGNSPKSAAVGANGWAKAMADRLRATFPGRAILYRPKPGRPHEPVSHDGLITVEPIDDALRGIGLVVCRHSNVAVDACRMGVSVVCEDGAAACIYPTLERWHEQPTFAQRQEFLQRLAWWQWSTDECENALFWDWIKGQMGED